MQFLKRVRGVSLTGYGLIVGLISIVALGAVTTVGSQTDELFTEVSDSLSDVGTDTPAQQSAPGAAAISVDSGALTVGAISGSGPGACTDLSVTNSGTAEVTGLALGSFTGSDPGAFQGCTASGNACTSSLAIGASCNFGVQLDVVSDGSYTADANISADDGLNASREVSGSASGLGDDLKIVNVGGTDYLLTMTPNYQNPSCETACQNAGRPSCNSAAMQQLQQAVTTSDGDYENFILNTVGLTFSTGSINADYNYSTSANYFGLGCTSGGWLFNGFNSQISGCSNSNVNTSTALQGCSESLICGGTCGTRFCVCN